jgi:1,4-alpha-glucan branching enzyme
VYVFRGRAPLEAPHVQVELKLAGEKARTVAVAGDFNGWDAVVMKKGEDGVWKTRLSLPPGRYRYAFVVDSEKWVADPQAATVVDSGYGGADSVLDISL